jgi:GLPGLI family protein
MIKKVVFIGVFLFTQIIFSQTDKVLQYKFIYNLTYQIDSTDVNSAGRSERTILFSNDSESIFLSENKFIRDSLLQRMKNISVENNSTLDISQFPRTKFKYKIVNKKSLDKLIYYDEIFTTKFMYEESKKKLEWNIHKDISNIKGFKCQKATTFYGGRYYSAWFTNEIPISDGPYKFKGLPGLIVKISDSKNHYVFELISHHTINYSYLDFISFNYYHKVSKSLFFKKQEDFNKNPILKMEEVGVTFDEQTEKALKIKMKKRNNPIELYNNKK